jgi:hypothetical protein
MKPTFAGRKDPASVIYAMTKLPFDAGAPPPFHLARWSPIGALRRAGLSDLDSRIVHRRHLPRVFGDGAKQG